MSYDEIVSKLKGQYGMSDDEARGRAVDIQAGAAGWPGQSTGTKTSSSNPTNYSDIITKLKTQYGMSDDEARGRATDIMAGSMGWPGGSSSTASMPSLETGGYEDIINRLQTQYSDMMGSFQSGMDAYQQQATANQTALSDLSTSLLASSGDVTESVNQLINDTVSSFLELLPETPDPFREFSFDEEFAKQSVEAEYDPYYKEKLSDFTEGINIGKQRAEENASRGLAYLTEQESSYKKKEDAVYSEAIRKANEGFAGRNLYFSGERGRQLGLLGEEKERGYEEFKTGIDYSRSGIQTESSQALEDLQRQERTGTRDIAREKTLGIESGLLGRRGEAMDKYNLERSAYYDQYPGYNYLG